MSNAAVSDLYSRSIFYFSQEELLRMKNTSLGLFGVGMGSIVSELAMRTGFQKQFLADGDVVQVSNLNRQNFTFNDCGHNKAKSLESRLKLINPYSELEVVDKMLTEEMLEEIIPRMDYVCNFIDFDSPAFLVCHQLCKKHRRPEIFTFNLGLSSVCLVLDHDTESFVDFFKTKDPMEIKQKLIEHIIDKLPEDHYLKDVKLRYDEFREFVPYDPQIAPASYMAAWSSIRVILKLMNGEEVKKFPKFYYPEI